MIYLDYNASAPLRPTAKQAIIDTLDLVGNPSSPHSAGRKLRGIIDKSRTTIQEYLEGERILFTSGGTEANALCLAGLGNLPVLVSSIEHDSVLKGADNPFFIPVTEDGLVNLVELEQALTKHKAPGLVSIMLVNNETGVIQPLHEVVKLAHSKGWLVHTDASQAVGRFPFSFKQLGVDLMTLSSHKCGGPGGVGALLLKKDLHLAPLIQGGGQEYGMRSGTLSAPLIVGFATALEASLQDDTTRLKGLQEKLESSLPEAMIYGKESSRVPNVSCVGMPPMPSDLQIIAFDLRGISVSAGSACSSGKIKTSHVLEAMGIPDNEVPCALRISTGWNTEESDIDAFIDAWKDIRHQYLHKEAS